MPRFGNTSPAIRLFAKMNNVMAASPLPSFADLHLLTVLAETRSYTQAARRLGISKASVSGRIAELERAAGGLRGGNGLRHFAGVGQRDLAADLAGGGIEDVGAAAALARHQLAVDPVFDGRRGGGGAGLVRSVHEGFFRATEGQSRPRRPVWKYAAADQIV